MKAFFAEEQLLHDPQHFMRLGRLMPSQDVAARVHALQGALASRGIPVHEPEDYGRAPLETLHRGDYLDYLETAYDLWRKLEMPGVEPGIEVLPNISPYQGVAPGVERPPCPASSLAGRTGYYVVDLATPIGPHSWRSGMRSAHSALAAADAVLGGDRVSYALSRPSGHHARRDCAAGSCFFANSGLAAQRLRGKYDRVATLDIDVHHGDGTQQIFYARSDVLTVSVHGDPDGSYPFFTGYAHERGAGEGEGFNLNLPLPIKSGDEAFLNAIRAGVAAIREFGAGALVVPLGFDAYKNDPLTSLTVELDAFREAGTLIGSLGLPTVLVQEGGYAVEALETALGNFLDGFLAS